METSNEDRRTTDVSGGVGGGNEEGDGVEGPATTKKKITTKSTTKQRVSKIQPPTTSTSTSTSSSSQQHPVNKKSRQPYDWETKMAIMGGGRDGGGGNDDASPPPTSSTTPPSRAVTTSSAAIGKGAGRSEFTPPPPQQQRRAVTTTTTTGVDANNNDDEELGLRRKKRIAARIANRPAVAGAFAAGGGAGGAAAGGGGAAGAGAFAVTTGGAAPPVVDDGGGGATAEAGGTDADPAITTNATADADRVPSPPELVGDVTSGGIPTSSSVNVAVVADSSRTTPEEGDGAGAGVTGAVAATAAALPAEEEEARGEEGNDDAVVVAPSPPAAAAAATTNTTTTTTTTGGDEYTREDVANMVFDNEEERREVLTALGILPAAGAGVVAAAAPDGAALPVTDNNILTSAPGDDDGMPPYSETDFLPKAVLVEEDDDDDDDDNNMNFNDENNDFPHSHQEGQASLVVNAVVATRDKWGINFSNRRVQIGLCLTFLAVAGLSIGLGVSLSGGGSGSSGGGDDNNDPPNSNPAIPPTEPPTTQSPTLTPQPTSTPTSAPTRLIWNQVGSDVDGLASNDYFGVSLSMANSGQRVAVGASNPAEGTGGLTQTSYARIYSLNSGQTSWTLLGNDMLGEANNDGFGSAVSLSGNGLRVAIGAKFKNDDTGVVRVFNVDNSDVTNWNLDGKNVGELFGTSVATSVDGNVVAGGGPGKNDGVGCVRVFEFVEGLGGEEEDDVLPWVQMGIDIDGETTTGGGGNGGDNDDGWGTSVSLSDDGRTVAMGGPYHDSSDTTNDNNNGVVVNSGQVRVYTYNGTNWTQVGNVINGNNTNDLFGTDVSLSSNGNAVAVGAPTNGTNVGYVQVYRYNLTGTNMWDIVGGTNDMMGNTPGDKFGTSISLSTDAQTIAVGAPTGGGTNLRGYTQVYTYSVTSNTWKAMGNVINGETNGDESGTDVSITGDGTRVAIGAPKSDANGESSGHMRVFETESVK